MNDSSSSGAEANFNKSLWAYMVAVCSCNAMGARLSCDRATIHGAVEHVKEGQKYAVLSDRSLSSAEREARLRRLDIDAQAGEEAMCRWVEANGLLR